MLGLVYYFDRQYDEAIELYQKVIEMDPNFSLVYYFIGGAYMAKSMYAEAVKSHQRFVELTAGSPIATGVLGYSYAMSGDRAKALEMYNQLNVLSKERYVSPFFTGWIHMGLNEKDQAFEHIEKAFLAKEPLMVLLKCWPFLDSLRSDARYDELLKKMGLDYSGLYLPNVEKIAGQVIGLPNHSRLIEKDLDRIISVLKNFT